MPNVRLNGSKKRIFNVFIGWKFIIASWVLQWWLKGIMTPVWRFTKSKLVQSLRNRLQALSGITEHHVYLPASLRLFLQLSFMQLFVIIAFELSTFTNYI